MSRGGKTSTTWSGGSSWKSGETKTIRIPIALEAEIMAYARALDDGIAVSHGNADIILNAIASYIELKKASRHPNQHTKGGKEIDINTRAWDELRKFEQVVKNQPEKLGLSNN